VRKKKGPSLLHDPLPFDDSKMSTLAKGEEKERPLEYQEGRCRGLILNVRKGKALSFFLGGLFIGEERGAEGTQMGGEAFL